MSNNTFAMVLVIVLGAWTLLLAMTGWLRRTGLLLHNAAWIIAFGVIGSGVIRYVPVSGYTWGLLIGGIAAFNIGMMVPHSFESRCREDPIQTTPAILMSRRGFLLLMMGYTAGFALYISRVISTFGLSGLVHNPSNARALAGPVIASVPIYGKLLLYLGPFLLVLAFNRWTIRPRISRLSLVVIVLYLVLTLLATLQRTNLFTAIAWELAVLLLLPGSRKQMSLGKGARCLTSSPSKRGRRVVGGMLVAAVALASFQYLAAILHKTGVKNPAIESALAPVLQKSSFASLFVYASGGVPAFSQLVSSPNREIPPPDPSGAPVLGNYNPQTWGEATFSTLLKVLPLAKPWNPVAPFIQVPFAYNVYTWFEPYYRDFRTPGVILMTFGSGIAIALVVRRRHRSAAWMLLAALLVGMTVFAAFANRYIDDYTIEYTLVLLWLGRRGRVTAVTDSRPLAALLPSLPHS